MNGITRDKTCNTSAQGAGRKGRLTQWDDAKGFGWIEKDGQRIFAHIKEFGNGQPRPVVGDEVMFTAGMDAQGRSCAKAVRLVRTRSWIGIGTWLTLAALLVLPLFSGEYLPLPRWVLPAVIVVAS
ncbi:MAG: cold shock domain-containing protein, partial [Verrucomicrobiaceae bacterium]